MRILRFFITSLLITALLAGTVFVIAREALLFLATNQVKSSITTIARTNYLPGVPHIDCQTQGKITSDMTLINVYAVQLGFSDDQHFTWEVICDSPLREPKVLADYVLPPFVYKIAGSGGLVWRQPYSAFTLEVWGRRRSFILENQSLRVTEGSLTQPPDQQPVVMCAGMGYQCCQLDSEQGLGAVASEVRDCPLSCFARCQSRPVILSFNTEPYTDAQTRVLEVASGDLISFNYVIDAGAGGDVTTELSFGDGEVSKGTEATATVEHTYRCLAQVCEYRATLEATDARGATSPSSTVNTLTIRVTGR